MELPRKRRQPISAVADYTATKTRSVLGEVRGRLEQAWHDAEIALFGNAADGDGGFEPAAARVDPGILTDRAIDWDSGNLRWPRQSNVVVMANLSCDMDAIDKWLGGADAKAELQDPKTVSDHTSPGGESAPDGKPHIVSPQAWRDYLDAKRLRPDFEFRRGGISNAAEAVARERGSKSDKETVRRNISRVREALRKQMTHK
jgi:hypothetical protein